jgi:hypothetical protein
MVETNMMNTQYLDIISGSYKLQGAENQRRKRMTFFVKPRSGSTKKRLGS